MLDWIDNPYTADRPEYQPENDLIPAPAQQQDPDQPMEDASSSSSSSSQRSEDTDMVRVPTSSDSTHPEPAQPDQPPPPPPNTHIYFPSSSSSHHTQIPQTHPSPNTASDAEGEQHFDQQTPPHSQREHNSPPRTIAPAEGEQ